MIKKIKDYISSNSKRLIIISYFFISFAILLFLIFNDHGFYNIYKINEDNKKLKELIKKEYIKKDSLLNYIDLIQNNKFYIEKIAREKYGFIKPGETVFLIPPK